MDNVLNAHNKGVPFFQSQIPSSGNKSFLQYKRDLRIKLVNHHKMPVNALTMQEKTYETYQANKQNQNGE